MNTKLRDIYRCEICGNVVEIINEGAVSLVCCNQPMNKLESKTQDQGLEKHVPVVEETETCPCGCGSENCGIKVKVGSVEHPMEEKHYITLIEVLTKDKVCRAELKPGMKPEACFCVKREDIVEVREFCNVHMLWKA
jgi:superoxide reductase